MCVDRTVPAYEALVRGLDGSAVAQILSQVNDANRQQFDQACRVKAVGLAAQLGCAAMSASIFCRMPCMNQRPGVFAPRWRRRTSISFRPGQLIFEITENERWWTKTTCLS